MLGRLAAPQVKEFAKKAMKTSEVRVDVKLNKTIWSKGVRNVRSRGCTPGKPAAADALAADAHRPPAAGAAPRARADLPPPQRRRGRQGAWQPEAAAAERERVRVPGARRAARRAWIPRLPPAPAAPAHDTHRSRRAGCASALLALARSEMRPRARCADACMHPLPLLPLSQEELYSYVTVVDTPEGFHGLGTTTVEAA